MDLSIFENIEIKKPVLETYLLEYYNGVMWVPLKNTEIPAEIDCDAISDIEEMHMGLIKGNPNVHFILWRCASRNVEMGVVKKYNF